MKKVILLATAALAFGGVAYAQDSSMTPAQTGTTPPDASSMPSGTQDMSQPPAGGQTPDASGGMSQTPPASGDMSGQNGMSSSQGGMSNGMQPGMSNGGAPSGSATGPNGPVSLTPTQGPTDLPMCSKTVTDNCKQGGSTSHHATRRKHH